MMLHYTRLQRAWRLMRLFETLRETDRATLRVVDYGCGTADYGLGFALYGYRVGIVDLEGPRLDFAASRFSRRRLPYEAHPVRLDDPLPHLGDKNDIILTADVLEHVPDLLGTLDHMWRSLPAGGYLWVSDFPMESKDVGGQHLANTAEARLAGVQFLESAFSHVPNESVKFLFRKR